ncbi:serine hydrolase domain-containing protein [Streptomyces sp. NPDC002082]|uniref:serine hydrolase domain-containing protein n=1 Tax=Streptomyces sp. NPDC002082 TaxID=3154772 RepID=UPI003321DF5B
MGPSGRRATPGAVRKRIATAVLLAATTVGAFVPAAARPIDPVRLVADGRIRLDDRAGRYVPQLSEHTITIRQLLKQTSGLPEYTVLVDWTRPGTPEDYLALALKEKPGFEPGTGWGYSNSVGGGRATAGRGTVTVYTTTWAAEGESLRHLQGAVDAALCAKRRQPPGAAEARDQSDAL